MVAGDLVNTASRIQSAAEPGTVLVGEITRRATEAAITYEAAGEHDLKGKTEPVPLHRALRVIAARGGAMRSAALEPPFVGRDRELRLVKELFHACGEEGKAQLVCAIGIAGIGKSRLAWEFEKYIDGLADIYTGTAAAAWPTATASRTGRSPRWCGCAPTSARTSRRRPALAKLQAAVEEHVPDPEERSWLEPRLAHLLGLAERTAPDREDLFSAWRLFFERVADRRPVILVFEDLQWADTGLLDFIEYLLEWSRNHPIFVLALSRPELAERRPGFGSAAGT